MYTLLLGLLWVAVVIVLSLSVGCVLGAFIKAGRGDSHD